MIGRIRSRREFDQLGRSGNRISATVLWCNWCLATTTSEPKIAFAVTRSYGTAVMRNRLRRRIQTALMAESEPIPPVMMLFGTRKARPVMVSEQRFEPNYPMVAADVTTILRRIRTQLGQSTGWDAGEHSA